MKLFKFNNLLLSLVLLYSFTIQATEYTLPANNSRLLGTPIKHIVEKGDYFQKIAEKYNVGLLALIEANPDIDPFLPEKGTSLVIPAQLLLPYIKREGIVVNLPELRLYYFSPDTNTVHVFPVGIGQQGLETPRTFSYISEKRKNPTWTPSKEMQQRYLTKQGKKLPDKIPPGPNNPFGKYALRLGMSEYFIHGSNQRFGIGMRSSSGCIRMYDNDIKWLYDNVLLKTPVRIIDQPIKMSAETPTLKLIEIHQPLSDQHGNVQPVIITDAVKRFIGSSDQDWDFLQPYFAEPKGLIVSLKRNTPEFKKKHQSN